MKIQTLRVYIVWSNWGSPDDDLVSCHASMDSAKNERHRLEVEVSKMLYKPTYWISEEKVLP